MVAWAAPQVMQLRQQLRTDGEQLRRAAHEDHKSPEAWLMQEPHPHYFDVARDAL